MEKRKERGPDWTEIRPDLVPDNKGKSLAEMLGREPTDFEKDLLANSDDKDGRMRLAAELIFNEGVDAPISILGQIKDAEQQENVKRLITEFGATLAASSGDKKEKQKRIRKELQGIIDKAVEE